MEKRETRRDRSWRYAARARRVHRAQWHLTGAFDCPCERSVWLFHKRKAMGCACRHRKKGVPKLGAGLCYLGEYRPAVRQRIQGRRLIGAWLAVPDVTDADL